MAKRKPKPSWLHKMGDDLVAAVMTSFAEAGVTPTENELAERTRQVVVKSVDEFVEVLIAAHDTHIVGTRKDERRFQRRNEKRWKPAFAALEALWCICSEVGGEFNSHHRSEAVELQDYRFEALTTLHARSLLVAREALALMRQGYADGALARWRTLHEVSAIALFIQVAEPDVALRYLASFRFQGYRAALQIDEIFGKGSRESFTDEELAEMRVACGRLEAQFGAKLGDDYEWARPGLSLPPKAKVTFRHIETAVGLTGFRPYYRWASQHNHGGYRPPHQGLGMVEARTPMLLIGPSDSGMIDPLQLVALSLAKATAALLLWRASAGIGIQIAIIDRFATRVAPIALQTEREGIAQGGRRGRRSGATPAGSGQSVGDNSTSA